MPVSQSILNKIKLLYRLAESPNENEAANAREMADKLIAKYNVSAEDLKSIADKKSAYSDEDLLFSSSSVINWKNDLASCLASEYDCKIIQVICQPSDGPSFYNYHIYGNEEDVDIIKRVFSILINKINVLIENNSYGRGQIYIESYCEGVSEAVRYNIKFGNLDLPVPNRNIKEVQEKNLSESNTGLAVKKDKEPLPPEAAINGKTLIKNVLAYFKGQKDGQYISLQDVLDEAAQEETRRISGHQKEESSSGSKPSPSENS